MNPIRQSCPGCGAILSIAGGHPRDSFVVDAWWRGHAACGPGPLPPVWLTTVPAPSPVPQRRPVPTVLRDLVRRPPSLLGRFLQRSHA